MRGFTACPFFVWGFPSLRSCIDLAVGLKVGSGIPLSWLRSRRYTRFIFTGPCPGIGSLVQVVNVPPPPTGSPALLARRGTGDGDLTADCPDEAGELARDRGHGDGLELASPDQRPVAPVEAVLRLPGDLANRTRRGRDLRLLVLAHPRRVLIAPRALHQHASRPPVASLGDRAANDRLAGRTLGWHQAEIGHQLARRAKAREVTDLGQERRRRDQIH